MRIGRYAPVQPFHSLLPRGTNEAVTNRRITRNLGILLMNSNCFAIFF